MLGFNHWSLLKGLAAIFCAVSAFSFALAYFIPAPASTITIAMSFKGSSYEHWALSYQEKLSRSHFTVKLRETDGPLDNLRLAKEPSSGVDVAFAFGGLTNSKLSPELTSMGRVSFAPIWIFYRGTETLERLTQLKGKRIAVPAATRVVVNPILAAHGVNPDNTTILALTSLAAAKALKDGDIDVSVQIIELNAPIVQGLLRDPTVRVMSVAQADAIARVYPFLTRLVLPQGVVDFERNIPANDVSLIATTQAVLIKKDLHPELIYLLAQAMLEEHSTAGVLQRAGEFPAMIDPEFPVAQTAIDFYKNGPSFLNRYLPFWMISHVQRLIASLFAIVAIILPLINYVPKFLRWLIRERIRLLYRRLRLIERELLRATSADQVTELQVDLEKIERAASILAIPTRYSDMLYLLLGHIKFTRERLAAGLADIRSKAAKVA
jgi:TRAP-type uncharacterized transport system substrate-binding protein